MTNEYLNEIRQLAADSYEHRASPPDYRRSRDAAEHPDKPIVFDETTPATVRRALGRKWKENLPPVLALVGYYKHGTSRKRVTVLPISTHSERLLDIFGSPVNVSNVIRLCLKCGLLQCVDESYRFGPWEPRAKRYAWNKQAQDSVTALADEAGIVAAPPVRERTPEYALTLPKKRIKRRAEGLEIKIAQKTSIPKDVTDDEILVRLLERYPQMKEAMETASRLNRDLPPCERMRCFPSIHRARDGRISKIGFRISNPIVSLKEHDNGNDDYNGLWRKEYLGTVFDSWAEYDVKSSIYRVSYLLEHGEWLPDEVDLYERMAGFPFQSKEERDRFKFFSMQLFFEPSARSLAHHLTLKGATEGFVRNFGDGRLVPTLVEAKTRMEDAIGTCRRSEIFLHESCVYLNAFRRMVEEEGWRVVQIYDGFYIRLDDGMDRATVERRCAEIVAEEAIRYHGRFVATKAGKGVEAA